MKAEKIIRLRMQNSTFCRRIPVVQGDTARTFRFILEDITLDGTEHARIYARKPSGAEIYDECEVVGSNEVIFTPETEQIFIETGIILAEIRVAKGEKLITSYSFEFEVRQSTMRTGDIPSSDEFNALERAIEEAKGLHEPEFTEAGKRENIVSGETMQILFGKIKKWFTDLGALITKIGNTDISSIGDGTVTGAITDLDKRSTKNTSDIDVERKRIDNIAKLPEGSTAGDAELADIRVAADGTSYDTAGESVRGQINQIDQKYEKETSSLKEDLDDCLKVKYLELKQDNLFNIDNLTVGVCDSDGSFTDNTQYRRTDYEFVKSNTTYSSWRMIWRNALGIIRIAFFDKNKKFISGDRDIGNIFTTPSDAYYVILTYVANENMTEERMPMVCEGNNVPEVYLPYKNEYIKKVVEYVKKDDLKPHAYMPDVIYCALGRTIDIYNNQVCIDADKFHLCWTCDIGFGEGRKFTVTPTEIGNHNLKLDIYNDANELLFTKTVILKVVSAITSGSYTILPIGDSMTYGGTQWQIEVQKNLSNGSMTYVGTQEHDGRGDIYYHEGYNGNTAYGFLNNATLRGLTNPFYNPDTSKFDWNYYKNTYSINPDIIQIELGTNDINGYTVDVAVENIAEMVDLIRKDDASIPIFICNAIYRSNQDGIAHQLNTQGYSIGNGVYKYGEDVKIQNLMIGLENRLADYKNVYCIPLALCHDSENNFGKKTIPLNSRSQETIVIPADSIHPNKTGEDSSTYGYNIVGYLQFADVMYSTLCGVLPTLN